MSVILPPANFCPNQFSLRMQTNQLVFASPYGGSEQVIDKGNDRWLASLSLPNRLFADAAVVEAFINALRGMTNTVLLFHFARKVPRGTMRGTPTILNASGAGLDYITVSTGVAGATLKAGDMLGVNGLLLQVAADCVANGLGNMTVPLINRLRLATSPSMPVTWDRPTAPFRLASPSAVQYVPGYAPQVDFEFVEAIP